MGSIEVARIVSVHLFEIKKIGRLHPIVNKFREASPSVLIFRAHSAFLVALNSYLRDCAFGYEGGSSEMDMECPQRSSPVPKG